MVELVPKIRRLSILFSARVHVKFSIIGRPRLLILSITRPRPCLKSRCPYNSVGRIINRESSFEKFISEISRTTFFFCYCTRDKEEERSNRIERKRNVKSKGKAHKDGARMQRMTKRREGHLHHGRGEGKHHFEVGCCIVHFALCPSPFAAEIQINDKSASAFQSSSPYFIPLSQYSIPPPSPQHWKSTGRITSPSSSISLLFEFPSTNSFTSSRKGNDYEDKEKSRIRSSFSAKRYDEYISFFFFSISNLSI